MKFAIPEISWHNRDPVLSVDFQPIKEQNGPLRLASGGTDSHVLIWYIIISENGSINLEVAADLTKHQKAVNVVRWSPNGQLLASGDDDSMIFVWKPKLDDTAAPSDGEEQFKETWVVYKILRGHMEDVLDMCWNSASTHLASGSVDNKLLLWDVGRGKSTDILTDHKGFVQGVSWDPSGQLIVTASTDRVFRVIDVATKKVLSRSSKAVLPFSKDHVLHGVKVRLYHDDTLQTYYRRLQFSPDGLLIAVPAGRIEPEQSKLDTKPINAVYIYTRYSLKVPACVIPCVEPALAVRWANRRYALRPGPPPALPTAARSLLAVATRRAVLLYDTQQKPPLALISNIHYTRLTDLTWSPDDTVLVASSTDGFCSVITFAEGELGDALPNDIKGGQEQTDSKDKLQQVEIKDLQENKNINFSSPKKKSFITFKTPNEKSPKKTNCDPEPQKTPVKLDVLMETAMPSWSDNSSNDVIKPKAAEPMDVDVKSEVVIIEDSEDIKLVYEESECNRSSSQSPPEKQNKEAVKDKSEIKLSTENRKSPEKTDTSSMSNPLANNFFRQAKVTDIKEPLTVKSIPSPKAPRRVSFVTLSSPKNKKKK